ncbi:MAG: ion transporter [Rhodospirillaceae bacterium]|jgi:voltage-gated sodium channel
MTTATQQSDSLIIRLGQWVEGRRAQNFITVLIVLNAITLGLETDGNFTGVPRVLLLYFDDFVLAVFSIEIFLKLLYRRLSFFKNGWNVFDFVIVGIALMPDSGPLSVLRALRIFRALRLLSVVPSMRKVAQALISAIPGIMSVGSIILLIFYIFSVLATNFFGNTFPDWFGNIGKSMFTLFQIMTLESWSMGIVRPVMEVHNWAWVFFVPFILITSFAVLNLFIGIIVDAMQSQSAEEHQTLRDENVEIISESSEIHVELSALREDVKTLKDLLESRSN